MKEYKVLGDGKLEENLNGLAQEGWRVVAGYTSQGFGRVILERDASPVRPPTMSGG